MTDEWTANVREARRRVPRTRGALGGVLLVLGGVWAALVPFVGPYGNLAFTPDPNATWKWTAARGWLEVLPGAVAVVGGLLLLFSTNRVLATVGGWLGVAAGAWLVIAPTMAEPLSLDLGTPDPNQTTAIRVAEQLTFFFGIGAAIVLVAALSLGRLSVVTVRDLQAADRRAAAEAEEEAEEARFAEEQRLFHEQRQDQAARERAEAAARERDAAEQRARFGRADDEPTAVADYRSGYGTDDRTQELTGPRDERRREADERFAAERERIAEEHRRGALDTASPEDASARAERPVAERPADGPPVAERPADGPPVDERAAGDHGAATPAQPQQGDYPPFYGNRETRREG